MSKERRYILVFISLLTTLATPRVPGAESTPTGKELARRALEYRKAIPAGFVEWIKTYPVALDMRNYDKVQQKYSISYTDEGLPYKSVVEWSTPKSSWTAVTLKTADGIIWEPGMWSIHGSYSANPEMDQFNRNIHDPRLLGLVTGQLSNVPGTLKDWAMWFADSRAVVVRTQIDGTSTLRAAFFVPEERVVTVWFDPEKGYNPVKISVEFAQKDFRTELKVDYRQYPLHCDHNAEDSLWFPCEVNYRQIASKEVRLHERLVVTNAEFGKEVPAHEFDQSSLPIMPGRRFVSDQSRAYVYKLGRLRPATAKDKLDVTQKFYLLPRPAN